ncbi:hypothetical protein BGZ54_007677 [Gamsiella multidivaricata]|nr:hypothetical protein BGZ54_007677 [Gamsiella multidivaricata]
MRVADEERTRVEVREGVMGVPLVGVVAVLEEGGISAVVPVLLLLSFVVVWVLVLLVCIAVSLSMAAFTAVLEDVIKEAGLGLFEDADGEDEEGKVCMVVARGAAAETATFVLAAISVGCSAANGFEDPVSVSPAEVTAVATCAMDAFVTGSATIDGDDDALGTPAVGATAAANEATSSRPAAWLSLLETKYELENVGVGYALVPGD